MGSRVVGSVLLVATLLTSTACGGTNDEPGAAPKNNDFTQGVVTPAAPKNLPWGQPGIVTGESGGQIKVTPVGVLYHRGPYKGSDPPENGWFVAIALRAEAVTKQDDFVAPAGGGGFRWRGDGQTIWGGEGGTSTNVWVGAVPEFGDPIEPGSPEDGVETFDIPAKGGRLLYINADESIVSWQLPTADTGTGLAKVRARIKEFS
ncbi:hypothetical protein ACGFNU_47620 [Spirillospora sp. NPDC048911]|uniref:hypothetical protein n=1 Tax=Spirillospora sp. NPDC048911 TaxID=3364527 RepID=UPI003723395E